jgi:hypothetical protein
MLLDAAAAPAGTTASALCRSPPGYAARATSPSPATTTGPAAELVGLSSVRQPLGDLGREAVRLLRQPAATARTVRLAPRFIARSNTVLATRVANQAAAGLVAERITIAEVVAHAVHSRVYTE